jgi:hypothetical protein
VHEPFERRGAGPFDLVEHLVAGVVDRPPVVFHDGCDQTGARARLAGRDGA